MDLIIWVLTVAVEDPATLGDQLINNRGDPFVPQNAVSYSNEPREGLAVDVRFGPGLRLGLA
jgi:hypothetical protein